MADERYDIRPIGRVESTLLDRDQAPRQPDEGAPEAWLVFDARVREALADIQVDDDLVVLTWLDRADRDVQVVHPRGDETAPLTGVFSTRSPDRPNPIGLHSVRVVEVAGLRLRVDRLEAIDQTPVVDVKPLLGPVPSR